MRVEVFVRILRSFAVFTKFHSALEIWQKYFLLKKALYVCKKISEASVQACSVKKMFLQVLQNSQENTCARVSFLIKLQA